MQCRILHETSEEIITTINHNDMQANKQAPPLQKLGTHHQNTRLTASSCQILQLKTPETTSPKQLPPKFVCQQNTSEQVESKLHTADTPVLVLRRLHSESFPRPPAQTTGR